MFDVFHLPLCSVWNHIAVFIYFGEVPNVVFLGRVIAGFMIYFFGMKMHCQYCTAFNAVRTCSLATFLHTMTKFTQIV
ncbi:hypothetical protein EUGRSUZ_E02593 [Eucalyptus grandis]|uniref:Uncharacterized protein n=2 Tax=Eucalyptus grandis TaxID=71139 RepID=A0ACC3KXX5_EUCGR|nr:hypothetical protein EUGRSUZ_E02593 [Eucalyptus grandis]